MKKPDGIIRYDKSEYVQNLDPIHIARDRRKHLKELVMEEERTKLRASNGSHSYAGIHYRLEICDKSEDYKQRLTKQRWKRC